MPVVSRLCHVAMQIANRWVMQYNFYINDSHWVPMFVRICPYLPFSAQVASISILALSASHSRAVLS